jgi:hypothetical protein
MDVVKWLFEAYLSSTPSQTSKASAQSEPIVAMKGRDGGLEGGE